MEAMDCVKCVCLMVFCLGAMAGLTEASPFSPISKFIPHPGKALEKPPHVEVPTQEDDVKLTGGVFGLPLKAIENFSGAISNGMGHKNEEHEEPNRHEVQNVERHEGQGKQHGGHSEQHEGHGEQHEGHDEEHEGHGEQHEGHGEQHEGHGEQHEGHGEQHEGHGEQHGGQERFGSIKQHANDPSALLKSELPINKLPVDKASDVVETVVEKAHAKSIIPKGDEEIKSRQRRNLPIPSTKVINSQPMVEPRYAVDSGSEPSTGTFFEGAKGIVIDEPNGLEQGNRPVIIYVNSVKKINFDSGSECRNCE